jgi:hypothetical protein
VGVLDALLDVPFLEPQLLEAVRADADQRVVGKASRGDLPVLGAVRLECREPCAVAGQLDAAGAI